MALNSSIQTISHNNFNSFLTPAKKTQNNIYYAKEGEPIYQKDMDSDEDGIVTFDELKDYCKENKADIKGFLKNYIVYHATNDIEKSSEEIEKDNGLTYAQKGDFKYEAVMDVNDDNKITYKEYRDYCAKHAKQKTKSKGYYENPTETPEGMIETKG